MERIWRFQLECDDEITPIGGIQELYPISPLRVHIQCGIGCDFGQSATDELPQAENKLNSSILEMRPYVESHSCGILSNFGIREHNHN